MINFVAAHGQKFEMGLNGTLPWRDKPMPADKARVRALVTGKKLVVGERTYNVYHDINKSFKTDDVFVICRSKKNLPHATVVDSIQDIVEVGKTEDLWVLGGGSIFTQLLPYAYRMYLTRIEAEFEADVFFPEYSLDEWTVASEEAFPADQENPYPYTFLELHRK